MAPTIDVVISQRQLVQIACAMTILTSMFVLARAGIQFFKHKAMQIQDYVIYTAYLLFLALVSCYLALIPTIYKISDLAKGLIDPWDTMQDDVTFYMRMMFITTSLFWMSLWSVKLSLLALYKKLIKGLPTVYTGLWWGVFVFCLVSLAGCLVSYVTACPDFVASMTRGECPESPRSKEGQFASLYTAYAVDIVSDFMIMLLPIKVVWSLQMRRGQKIAVMAIFASGLACVAFATLRVIQLSQRSDKTKSANISSTWLALWSIVETTIAICIGCCPAFASLWRSVHTPEVQYDTQGYARHNQNSSQENPYHPEAMRMDAVAVGPARSRQPRRHVYWNDATSSQEELAADIKGIKVTYTVEQENKGQNTP